MITITSITIAGTNCAGYHGGNPLNLYFGAANYK
jgi:hypothetical protein